MEKTKQQLRFEAAWHIKWPTDEPFIFKQDKKGYTWREVQDTFEGWQLCEASALERAAVECERLKGLLREAADDLESWADYASEYLREKHDLAGTVKQYREAGEVTK